MGKISKKLFNELSFEELINYLREKEILNFEHYETIREFIKYELEQDNILVARIFLDAIDDYPYANYFQCDFSCGTCQDIIPVYDKKDLKDLLF